MKIIFPLVSMLIFQYQLLGQTDIDWAHSTGGASFEEGNNIATDNSGNIYITGSFSDTVDFDPSSGVNLKISKGSMDMFIQKLDPSGNLIWIKTFGGSSGDTGYSISIDNATNIYVTGYFSDTVDFDAGIDSSFLYSAGTPGTVAAGNIYVLKLNSFGDFIWAKSFGGWYGSSIATDSNENVYLTGIFAGTDLMPGSGILNTPTNGSADFFILKLNSLGNCIWAKAMGGTNSDYGYSIKLDPWGGICVAGIFSNTVDFDPGSGVSNKTSQGGSDVFVQKLDTAGNFLWVRTIGGTSGDICNSMVIDGLGSIYITGNFTNTVDFDPGSGSSSITSNGVYDIFIEKLDSAGNYLWANSIGGTLDDRGQSITLNNSGSIYLTGKFRGEVDFDSDTGNTILTSGIGSELFVEKMDSNGTFLWVKAIKNEGGAGWLRSFVTADLNGNVYVTGTFKDTLEFPITSSVASVTSSGGLDVFLFKMNAYVNIFEMEKNINVTIYPNPTNNYLNIIKEDNSRLAITVFNSQGRVMESVFSNNKITEIDISKYPSGIYFLELNVHGKYITKKIIKQ